MPCPGLADAVEHADEAAIDAAVAAAAALTPEDVTTVVLGCTHYELVAERIRAAVQRPAARPSSCTAPPRRSPPRRCAGSARPAAVAGRGALTVLLSGRPAGLAQAALRYAEAPLIASPVSAP